MECEKLFGEKSFTSEAFFIATLKFFFELKKMQQYRNIDEVLADRRRGTKLSEVVENILNSPYVLEQLETPFDVVYELYPGDYVDASTISWHKLPVELQIEYSKAYQQWYANRLGYTDTKSKYFISSIHSIATTLIPPMRYLMGSSESEEGHEPNEKQKIVTVGKPFWMSQYKISGYSYYSPPGRDMNRPITHITHWDALNFCKKHGLFLPSEAEWELACRAGTTTPYSFGYYQAQLENYAWYIGNSLGYPRELGRKLPNAWGLYDMHGNVYEWTRDKNKKKDREVIYRGSYYNSTRFQCRSACRDSIDPGYSGSDTGFRIVWYMIPTGYKG